MRKIYLSSPTRMVAWRRRIVALLRVCCGFLCAADAVYRWLAIQSPLLLTGHRPSSLAPGWFASGLHLAHIFTLGVATIETLIACCLLCGALTGLACTLGIFLALLGCATTGALTVFLGAGPFDLGILFVTVLSFLGLGLANAGQAYGIDALLLKCSCQRRLDAASESAAVERKQADQFQGSQSAIQALSLRQLNGKLSLSAIVISPSLAEPEVQAAHVASAPKKRQRVLFM